MGATTTRSETPRFRVRASGSFEQKPGCPASTAGLPADRLQHLCLGECDNPSDSRRAITRIEVIRVRPQNASEPLQELIESPWKTFSCDPALAQSGCEVSFSDPEFAQQARDTVYYVRAIEAPGLAINAASLSLVPCTEREKAGPDCLAPVEERAWSSPIYVDYQQR